jgi:predicted AAA+ superfamily ATPase
MANITRYRLQMSQPRYLQPFIEQDLARKMVFVGGPRQVGKTTLCKSIGGAGAGYLNFDDDEDRERILQRKLPNTRTWIFDEIHKYRRWRGYLKGLFDKYRDRRKILVSGSARLDLYRFGGDSLQGRYHYHRLHPLSCKELAIRTQKDLELLLRFGGFPEPFFAQSEVFSRRWSREYRTRLIREEVATLERVEDLSRLEMLMMALPERVGSPLSLNALREDLQVSHDAVRSWVNIFERLYAVFRIAPFGAPKLRAVKKEQKHYHFDWTLVAAKGPRFENMVASHLLKWCHFVEDTEGYDMELRYFRDDAGREVDFVVLQDRNPILFIEAKSQAESPARGLQYLHNKFPQVRAVQVAHGTKKAWISGGIECLPAVSFLSELA